MANKNEAAHHLETARRHHAMASYAQASFSDPGPETQLHLWRAWFELACAFAVSSEAGIPAPQNFLDCLPQEKVLPKSVSGEKWRNDILLCSREEELPLTLPLHLHLWALQSGINSASSEIRTSLGLRAWSTQSVRATILGLLASAAAGALIWAGMHAEFGPTPWRAEYYAGMDLQGAPLLKRNEKRATNQWDQESPSPLVPVDEFSARWRTCLPIEAPSEIIFKLESDDGSRLLVDRQTLSEKWEPGVNSTVTAPLKLSSGSHLVELEYFEHRGNAGVSLQAFVTGYSQPLLEPKRLTRPVLSHRNLGLSAVTTVWKIRLATE